MNWNPDIGIPLAIAGILLLIAIALFGRPRKPGQGRRRDERDGAFARQRQEPRLDDADPDPDPDIRLGEFGSFEEEARQLQAELELIDQTLAGAPSGREDMDAGAGTAGEAEPAQAAASEACDARKPAASPDVTAVPVDSQLGRRGTVEPKQIVTLFVAAREGQRIDGASIVVAAEKLGLVYGHMGIFHRLMDGRPEGEPVFSVANLVAPGHFDLRQVSQIETPGLTFFMTLPGPMSALDAWEAMLPAAQRMADLLDAVLLDEQRNALGRQRIAHIRDELRHFDREQEREARRPW